VTNEGTGRAGVRLDDDEVERFLAGRRKVQVATVGPGGTPHLTTLFYVLDAGRIAFWTYAASQKVKNLRRDPRITCLVEDGEDYFELRGVSVRGRATLVEEYDAVRALGARVMAQMAGEADLGDLGDEILDGQARKRVGVIVEPERVASWDHRKMAALPGQRA
jgi:PPOX class probable F420-dependent enzyme